MVMKSSRSTGREKRRDGKVIEEMEMRESWSLIRALRQAVDPEALTLTHRQKTHSQNTLLNMCTWLVSLFSSLEILFYCVIVFIS